jgi:hypothetical protein
MMVSLAGTQETWTENCHFTSPPALTQGAQREGIPKLKSEDCCQCQDWKPLTVLGKHLGACAL